MNKLLTTLGLLGVLTIIPGISQAQDKAPLIGVQAGPNIAEFYGPGAPRYTLHKGRLSAGTFVILPVKAPFHVELQALFASKGARLKEGATDYKILLRYFELPAMAQVTFGDKSLKFYGNAGPYFGFLLDADRTGTIQQGTNPYNSTVTRSRVDESIESAVKRWDFGLKGSIGTHFPFYNGRMKIALSYSRSIPEIQNSAEPILAEQQNGPLYNSTILLSIGFGLSISPFE